MTIKRVIEKVQDFALAVITLHISICNFPALLRLSAHFDWHVRHGEPVCDCPPELIKAIWRGI